MVRMKNKDVGGKKEFDLESFVKMGMVFRGGDEILLLEVFSRLFRRYGNLPEPTGTPFEVLVSTLLSQNTNDRNRDKAYQALRSRFPDWRLLVDASEAELAQCLRPAGLNQRRAKHLKAIVNYILGHGFSLTLRELCEMHESKALEWLKKLPGVGLKTAFCVLAFGCRKDLFPVDTHILRITKRLGVIPPKTNLEKAHNLLAPLIPKGCARQLHLLLIRFGKEVCKARRPLCDRCPFPEFCLYPHK